MFVVYSLVLGLSSLCFSSTRIEKERKKKKKAFAKLWCVSQDGKVNLEWNSWCSI